MKSVIKLENVMIRCKWLEKLKRNLLYHPAKAKKKLEFTPHALGEIKSNISREEIYYNRFESISEVSTINPFDQTANEKKNGIYS